MECTLLVCKPVVRHEFKKQEYLGEDDIFALVEKGSFCFDDGSGTTTVGALEGVNFKRGVYYKRHMLAPTRMYLFRYRSEGDIFGSGKVIFSDTARIRSTLSLLHMTDEIIRPDEFQLKRALFLDIVNQYRLENAVKESTFTDEVIRSAMTYIHANLHFKLDLAELSKQHYLSYVQFVRRFKSAVGTTPQDYITALRVKRAQTLLTESELSVKEIAANCGFANEYYFSNFFRNHCQMSPTKYREMIQSTDAIVK